MDTPTTRSTSVAVIGAMAVVIGGTMAATALIRVAVVLFFIARHSSAAEVAYYARFFIIPAGLRIVFGVPAFVTGILFLRCRWWARVVLEVLGWVGGLFCVACGIYGLWLGAAKGPGLFQATHATTGLNYFVYAALLGVMIYHLHKPSVREAFSRAVRPDAAAPDGVPEAPS